MLSKVNQKKINDFFTIFFYTSVIIKKCESKNLKNVKALKGGSENEILKFMLKFACIIKEYNIQYTLYILL